MIRCALLLVVLGAVPCRAEVPKLFRKKPFTCVTLAEAVNHYVAIGEDAAVKELESLTSEWNTDSDRRLKKGFSANERVSWVCRILFMPKGRQPLRAPGFGQLSLPWNSMPLASWPLYPVATSGSSYFVLSEGYTVLGQQEDPKEYLKFCRANGTFRKEAVPIPTTAQALKDLENLGQSEAWKAIKWKGSGKGWSYDEKWVFGRIMPQADKRFRKSYVPADTKRDKDSRDENKKNIKVPIMRLEVSDTDDPVLVGEHTTYVIQISNLGTKDLNQVRVKAIVPDQLQVVEAKGHNKPEIKGQIITFPSLDPFKPDESRKFTIKVKALKPADVRFRVEVQAKGFAQPIVEEEATTIFDMK